jgi:hypothetical protein
MAIIQISKIQQRAGDLVDLPQLDEAEFGFASDAKRLFIGKEDPAENIEVLTSYSEISFSQIEGSGGNLDVDPLTLEDGQVMTYDGNNWVNRGGNSGGLITLGNVGNVRIDGGSIGYVLETDGTGNLSWTPKSTIIAFVENASNANPVVITTTQDNFFTQGAEVTFTNLPTYANCISDLLNGNSYYADILTSNTFALYTDVGLSLPLDGSGEESFPYTNVSNTTTGTNIVTVGDADLFAVNDPIIFIGTTFGGIQANTTYYVLTASSTSLTISETLGGAELTLLTASGSCNVYVSGGRIVSAVTGGGATAAGGSNTTVQFNNNNILDGDADFTWDYITNILTINGNANVGNLNASGIVQSSRYISNISTGTAPLAVSSTTRVANLNVAYSNVTDFSVVTTQTTGTFYPVFTNANTTANLALSSNANLSFNAATGALSATLLTGTLTTSIQPNIANIGNGNSISIVGNLNPSANVIYNLGNSTNRWNDIYLSGSTIYLGNATIESTANGVLVTNASGGSFLIGGTDAANNAALVNGNSNVIVSANSNVNISVAGTANILRVTSTGANVTGTANITGNANVGNLGTAGLITATGNITGGNITTGGRVVATGNVTGGNLTTAGALSVTGNANVGNIGGTNGVFTTVTGGLLTNAQPNITSVGTLSSLIVTGNISAGNVSGGNLVSANFLTGTLTTGSQPNITTIGTLTSLNVTGNITAGNVYANAGTIGANLLTGTLTTQAQPNITSVGTLTSLNVTGNIASGNVFANSGLVRSATLQTTAITTGATATAGTITGNWTLTSGSRLQATYADLAEYYAGDAHYIAGTVLDFGGEKEVTIAGIESNKIAGVVSADPAYVMNGMIQCDHPTVIALQGRVPCRVKGKVRKGDMMISAGNGYAKAATSEPKMGTVIGKALANFDGEEGVIEVVIGRL